MLQLPIIGIPTPSLRVRSREVTITELLSRPVQQFIDAMIPTMYGDDGIGLAAPQVANNIRIAVIGKDADKSLKNDLVLVNPTWERISKKTNIDTEGCLSVPGKMGKVKRFTDLLVKALDRHGNPIEFKAHKYFARVIQHEVDHLDGILYIDRAFDIEEVQREENE